MNNDLISRNDLLKKIDEMPLYWKYEKAVSYIRDIIKLSPAVDAVEAVRCKDCKHYGGVVFGNGCRRWSAPLAGMKNCTKPNDFCSYGERRAHE